MLKESPKEEPVEVKPAVPVETKPERVPTERAPLAKKAQKKIAQKKDPTKRRLTLKQQIFVREYVTPADPRDIGNGTKAAKKAYPGLSSDNMNAVVAKENIRKPHIRDEIIAAFNSAGLTTNRAAQRLAHWTESNKHDASLRALSLYGKWRGLEESAQVNVNVVVKEEERELLSKYETMDIS